MFIPSCFFFIRSRVFLKIPNAITNSFATVEIFRDVSYKKIQREIYFSTAANLSKKKVYQRLAICRQYPFFKYKSCG